MSKKNVYCPLMSKKDQMVECTEECMWYMELGCDRRKCAMNRLADYLGDIMMSSPCYDSDSESDDV